MILNSEELASLVHLPAEEVQSKKLIRLTGQIQLVPPRHSLSQEAPVQERAELVIQHQLFVTLGGFRGPIWFEIIGTPQGISR